MPSKSLTNKDYCRILNDIALLLELKGEKNPFKIRAYLRASKMLSMVPWKLAEATSEQVKAIEGIGKSIAEKISELTQTGHLKFYEELCGELPQDILTLLSIPGLGVRKVKVLYEGLGVTSITSLEKVCREGKLISLPGFGRKTSKNLLRSLEDKRRNAGKFLLVQVLPLAVGLVEELKRLSEVSLVAYAGSIRRGKDIVHDIDLVVAGKASRGILSSFLLHPWVESVLAKGVTKCTVRLRTGIPCDLRVVTEKEYPFALAYFTGSREHNIRLRSLALKNGWSLNEYGFTPAEKRVRKQAVPSVDDEAGIYQALGLQFIPPELREDHGEFAAAAAKNIPPLVKMEDLKGTFHCHTTDSDGYDSLERVAEAGMKLGFQYLGISDHSKSLVQANGLNERALMEQCKTISQLNATYERFHLFSGIECDILKDGRLDFSDEVLASLDYTIASVHTSFSLSAAAMTRRIIRALSNPYVTVLGHLTGRLLLRRLPYQVDIPAVIEAAASAGTWIELNANPNRLDMEYSWWPLAREKKVKCVINPDAHSARDIQDVSFGVCSARRGGLTPRDVMNCLTSSEIAIALQAKRVKV
ncbi:DNA polymerase/3'-5' exonuclease PolX [Candidatus Xiphinematobacter sp. Idaho Grape]|uniref:DNA polymerase/3'-5' exonuclease PolX n=1 Tax=Candidatus Xiphinematobacter sp. Idaho Grape TaxID=1704307 RepID=UPI000706E211|nr:DNA polymerase/3'-5' exonuclease PolX [Candidatus Xiphinematobacter sp. Idaho Grape]ALJ56464.1 DNA polymerase/3'-5' exonuclease PolX [Candidatus Xiphinematobacter sp. Idaho Grape]